MHYIFEGRNIFRLNRSVGLWPRKKCLLVSKKLVEINSNKNKQNKSVKSNLKFIVSTKYKGANYRPKLSFNSIVVKYESFQHAWQSREKNENENNIFGSGFPENIIIITVQLAERVQMWNEHGIRYYTYLNFNCGQCFSNCN